MFFFPPLFDVWVLVLLCIPAFLTSSSHHLLITSHITHDTSYITSHHISHLTSHISHLSSLISHLSSHISHLASLISHLSSLICHLLSVTAWRSAEAAVAHRSADPVSRGEACWIDARTLQSSEAPRRPPSPPTLVKSGVRIL